MLVKMNKSDYESMDNEHLSLKAIEPIMLSIRAKSIEFKQEVYDSLNKAQRALFMFRVLYDHSKSSKEEFAAWFQHLNSEPKTLNEIKEGLTFYNAVELFSFITDAEKILNNRGKESLQSSFPHYIIASKIAMDTIGEYIKANSHQFVEFE